MKGRKLQTGVQPHANVVAYLLWDFGEHPRLLYVTPSGFSIRMARRGKDA